MSPRPILYRLNAAGTPVPMDNGDRDEVLKWGRWFEQADRIVKQSRGKGLLISTVFLGVDYAFQGAPVCWETIVVKDDGNWNDLEMERCAGGREQAEAMHEAMCRKWEVPLEPVK